MRGEYGWGFYLWLPVMELPPRARRIQAACPSGVCESGTTSACAENTKQTTPPPPRWNYLRVRGEYSNASKPPTNIWELPPRARRILHLLVRLKACLGTTSACAENTHPTPPENPPGRNYLRVRGEYALGMIVGGGLAELPPRARRILCGRMVGKNLPGTTSACAENTPCRKGDPREHWNYLRVRGEYA